MNVDDPDFLRQQIADVLSFYYPTCRDECVGGHIAQLDEETGAVYDRTTRHLVATCRFVRNFAIGAELGLYDWCESACRHGFAFLEFTHRRPGGGYAWLLNGREVLDDRRSPYGHAFVLLAHAHASRYSSGGEPERIDSLLDRFTDANGLLGPARSPDWEPMEPYRGLNANMHACEAYLAAFEASGDERFLLRAMEIAEMVTVDLADADGRIWEHYGLGWEPDYDYYRCAPDHQFRPWGFQPGHHAEWAKLLAGLRRHRHQSWLIERAEALFQYALVGWDSHDGGFFYTLDLEDDPVLRDKFGWAVAEGIGASAALYEHTGNGRYRDWYRRFWSYAQRHFVAPGGNWYARLNADNERIVKQSGAEVEPGYHPIGACYEGIRAFTEADPVGGSERG